MYSKRYTVEELDNGAQIWYREPCKMLHSVIYNTGDRVYFAWWKSPGRTVKDNPVVLVETAQKMKNC